MISSLTRFSRDLLCDSITSPWKSVLVSVAFEDRVPALPAVDGDGTVVKKESVLVIERARLEIRRNSFPIRAAETWNELPETVKKSTSINGFKTAYDKWMVIKNKNLDDEKAKNETSGPEN